MKTRPKRRKTAHEILYDSYTDEYKQFLEDKIAKTERIPISEYNSMYGHGKESKEWLSMISMSWFK